MSWRSWLNLVERRQKSVKVMCTRLRTVAKAVSKDDISHDFIPHLLLVVVAGAVDNKDDDAVVVEYSISATIPHAIN
jgi:hypothetical protein